MKHANPSKMDASANSWLRLGSKKAISLDKHPKADTLLGCHPFWASKLQEKEDKGTGPPGCRGKRRPQPRLGDTPSPQKKRTRLRLAGQGSPNNKITTQNKAKALAREPTRQGSTALTQHKPEAPKRGHNPAQQNSEASVRGSKPTQQNPEAITPRQAPRCVIKPTSQQVGFDKPATADSIQANSDQDKPLLTPAEKEPSKTEKIAIRRNQ
jgi:hypothetical protein